VLNAKYIKASNKHMSWPLFTGKPAYVHLL